MGLVSGLLFLAQSLHPTCHPGCWAPFAILIKPQSLAGTVYPGLWSAAIHVLHLPQREISFPVLFYHKSVSTTLKFSCSFLSVISLWFPRVDGASAMAAIPSPACSLTKAFSDFSCMFPVNVGGCQRGKTVCKSRQTVGQQPTEFHFPTAATLGH